jgi:NAD(P)-dependent dehydrogenase (short-subunit alcohol dehydrogenase family)
MPRILITGSSRGIGFALTKVFAEKGWNVIATCRNPERASMLHELVRSNGQIRICQLDVADFNSITDLKETLEDERIDVLLNNAGIYGENSGQNFGGLNYPSWRETFEVNTLGPIKMAETFFEQVQKSERKIIATISTMMSSLTENFDGRHYIYRSTKAALNMVLKNLSIDMKPQGITVLILHPGWVRTDMGGGEAPLSPSESAIGLYEVISNATLPDTGKFYAYDGKTIPW